MNKRTMLRKFWSLVIVLISFVSIHTTIFGAGAALSVVTNEASAQIGTVNTIVIEIKNSGDQDFNGPLYLMSGAGEKVSEVSSISITKGGTGFASFRLDLTGVSSSGSQRYSIASDGINVSGGVTVKMLTNDKEIIYVDNNPGTSNNDNTPPPTPPSVTEVETTPNLVMTSPTSSITVRAGKSTVVSVTLKNTGTATARNIYPVGKPSGGIGVIIKNAQGVPNIPANDSATFQIEVTASKDLENGPASAGFGFSYIGNKKAQFSGDGSIQLNILNEEKSQKAPNLILKDFQVSNSQISPGDQFRVTAVVENTSETPANNVHVVVGGIETAGINLSNTSNNAYFEQFGGKATQTVSFELLANRKMKQGSYPLTFDVKYKDKETKDYGNTYSYYVSIGSQTNSSNEKKAILEISEMSAPTATFDTGQSFGVSFVIKNVGEKEAKKIKITGAPAEADKDAIVPKSANTQQIMTLQPGESKALKFSFAATANSKTQNYSVGFTVEYENGLLKEDDTKEIDKFEQFSGINIVNSKADAKAEKEEAEKDKDDKNKDKNKPKIIVSNFEVEPILVMAGKEFDLNLTFKNTHPEKLVKNIKATITVPETISSSGTTSAGENVFTPVNASNTFYIDQIQAKQSIDQYIRMFCVPDAAPKNYVMIVNFEYEDGEGIAHTEKEEIGINVRQIAKFELGDANIPAQGFVNEPIQVDITIQNTGKVTLSNLKIKMVGDGFDTSGTEIVYGNFAEGDHDYYSTSFTPTAEGDHKITILVSYDESTGERVEKEYDYTIKVEPDMNGGRMGMESDTEMFSSETEMDDKTGMPIFTDPETGEKMTIDKDGNMIPYQQSSGISPFVWIGAGIVILGAAGIVGFVLMKKRKKGFDDFNE